MLRDCSDSWRHTNYRSANTFISFICFHWFGKSFIILKVKKVKVPKNCHIALHVNSVLPNEGAKGEAAASHLEIIC